MAEKANGYLSSSSDSSDKLDKKHSFTTLKKNALYSNFKVKKIRFDDLKFFRRMHILATRKKRKGQNEFESDDDDDEEHSDDSDIDSVEF
jgi:hypothetical protein